MNKLFDSVEKYIIYIVIFLIPITVLSISVNPYVVPKLAIGVYGILLLLVVKAIRVIYKGKLELHTGDFDFPVALIALSYILATFFRTPNRMEALLLPGTATAFLIGIFLYYLINQLKTESKDNVSYILLLSGSIFALFQLFSTLGVFTKIPQLPDYMKSTNFSPDGGYLPSLIFLLVLVPLALKLFLSKKDVSAKAFAAIATLILLTAIVLNVFYMLPGKQFAPKFPSMASSWSIAVDSLKDNPLFGVGPGNYLTAFNRFRPITYNSTDLWALKFGTANNFYLTVLTETGMLGLAGILLLIYAVYKNAKKDIKEKRLVKWGFSGVADLVALTLLAILLFLFPATELLTILLFVVIALNTKTHSSTLNLTTQANDTGDSFGQKTSSRLPALIIALPIILLSAYAGYRATNILAAEYTFKKSVDALGRNEAQNTYNTMAQAIQRNPYVDRYHTTFSRVNLLLANAIATSATTQNAAGDNQPQLNDTQRQNITQLIQQAITEAKAAVSVNPRRAANWENLGAVYQAIIPFAQGADGFAAQTYSQAVALDPYNPSLRISLGSIYYSRGDYDSAVRVLELAVAIKPDLANAHYNLAYAYDGQKQYDKAVQQMTLVLSLIADKNSNDYQVATKALEDMQAKQKASGATTATQPTDSQNLTAPQTQEPAIEPPIQLPEDAEPPENPISPTPTQSAGASQITPTPSQ